MGQTTVPLQRLGLPVGARQLRSTTAPLSGLFGFGCYLDVLHGPMAGPIIPESHVIFRSQVSYVQLQRPGFHCR